MPQASGVEAPERFREEIVKLRALVRLVGVPALHAFSILDYVPGWNVVEGEYVLAALHRFPYAQRIDPREGLTEANLDAAIAEARRLVREQGRDELVWLAGPDHPWLGDALAQRGWRNEDTPGFEAVENAMALLEAPTGEGGEDVEVAVVEDSFEEFATATRVELVAFGIPAEGRAKIAPPPLRRAPAPAAPPAASPLAPHL